MKYCCELQKRVWVQINGGALFDAKELILVTAATVALPYVLLLLCCCVLQQSTTKRARVCVRRVPLDADSSSGDRQ